MTKNRNECGVSVEPIGTKKKFIDKDGIEKEYSLISEIIITDDNGFIIGVEKQWQ